MTPNQLAIHTFTNQPWSVSECIENYARAGIGGISIWRETVVGENLKKVRKQIVDSGLKPVSLVRGGFFTGKTEIDRNSAIKTNLEAIKEAQLLGLPMIVLVCGATVGQSPDENLDQIEVEVLADRLVLPVEAVQVTEEGPSVRVRGAGGTKWRPVEIGPRSGGRVVIESGVSEGEIVLLPDRNRA